MLFTEITIVYSQNDQIHERIVLAECRVLNVKAGGTTVNTVLKS